MCRNIRPLFNFDPPATDEEVRDATGQFVRKLAGFAKPSHANEAVFDDAEPHGMKAVRGDPIQVTNVPQQGNPMPQVVNLVLILTLAVAPVYAVCLRSRWSSAETKSLMVAIPLLLFLLNAPLHEASHSEPP